MATTSKTLIANLALSHIHDKGIIENVETEKSAQARAANLWYDPARRQALADFDYGFARKRLALSTHGKDPPAEWGYRYQYPSDCVSPRRIENPLGRRQLAVPFEIEQADDGTMSILVDHQDAVLVYTRDALDPAFFTPHFVLALSYLLAHYIAGPLTGKNSIKDDMIVKYNTASNVGAAHEANATAAGTDGSLEAPWIRGR